MEDRIYDYWAATLQNGYLGDLAGLVDRAGGARSLFGMTETLLKKIPGITDRLAEHIIGNRSPVETVEKSYYEMMELGICYVNHTDDGFPEKLTNIPGMPYGLFVKGALPDPQIPSVAVVGARECSEYGRLMAEFLGSRLAKEGVQIISGMAWGIDGIAQNAALSAGGRSFAVLGCGADVVYPAKNRQLYSRLCDGGSGIISEYAPGTRAVARLFPPRNRIISGLCDVLIVVEARKRSGTLITVDMAIDQGRCVMVIPGRLTDSLSMGCLNLLYQGALPVTGIESVLEQLNIGRQLCLEDIVPEKASVRPYHRPSKTPADVMIPAGLPDMPEDMRSVADLLTLDPQSTEAIAEKAGLSPDRILIILTELELDGIAREVSPGYFVRCVTVS